MDPQIHGQHSSTDDTSSRFLQLPAELRILIYGYFHEVTYKSVCGSIPCWIPYTSDTYNALLRVSKFVKGELEASKLKDTFTDRPVLFCGGQLREQHNETRGIGMILQSLKVAQAWDRWQLDHHTDKTTQDIDERALFSALQNFQNNWKRGNHGTAAPEKTIGNLRTVLKTVLFRSRRQNVVEMRIRTWDQKQNRITSLGSLLTFCRDVLPFSDPSRSVGSTSSTYPSLVAKVLGPKDSDQATYFPGLETVLRRFDNVSWETATEAEMAFDPEQ
jgi:hypothetical protein